MASVPPVDAPIAITMAGSNPSTGATAVFLALFSGAGPGLSGRAARLRGREAAAARIFVARASRSSPTEYGPPGLARTSTAPASRASIDALHDECASELMTI